MTNKYLISIPEAAKIYGINRTRLYELTYIDPELPIIKIGSVTKINRTMFEEYLNRKTANRENL